MSILSFTGSRCKRVALAGIVVILVSLAFLVSIPKLGAHTLLPLRIPRLAGWSTGRRGHYDTCVARTYSPSEALNTPSGYKVFNNLWFHDGSFYFLHDESLGEWEGSLPPAADQIVTPNTVGFRVLPFTAENMAGIPGGSICLGGTTIYNNDDPFYYGLLHWFTPWHTLAHYYHFVSEIIFGSMAALAIAGQADEAGEVALPRWFVVGRDDRWEDNPGMNEAVARAVIEQRVIERDEWREMSKTSWIRFNQVVITDRRVATKFNPTAEEWNRMVIPVIAPSPPFAHLAPPPTFFDAARRAFLSDLTLPSSSASTRSPKVNVVYISRQLTHRRLDDQSHEGLLDALDELDRGEWATTREVFLERMSVREQVEVVRGADVLIGVHGNGFTHDLWRDSGVIIEIFAPGAFHRDYQAPAALLGHTHIAVWNDTVHAKEIWETHPDYPMIDKQHHGIIIPLDQSFIRGLLRSVVSELSEEGDRAGR